MNPGFHTYKLESWVIIDGGGFLSEKYVETLIWVWGTWVWSSIFEFVIIRIIRPFIVDPCV